MKHIPHLLFQLTIKDIALRYKGSALGFAWAALTPLLMLTIYTIVFSAVFDAKWGVETDNRFAFAMALFCGLIIINMAIEVTNRSVVLIASHVNYVKKVIFPLGVLPLTITLSSFFNCIVGFLILFAAQIVLADGVYVTVLFLPIVLLPFLLIVVGFSFVFSSISVYVKDMVNFMSVVSALLMFTSPVFFSLEDLPETVSRAFLMNPFTFVIINVRNVVFYGIGVDWTYWLISFVTGMFLFFFGWRFFKRLRKGFADVL